MTTEPETSSAAGSDNPAARTFPNLIWVDLEMTGLNYENDLIIEIATIITNASLEIVAEGPNLVIHLPDTVLDNMGAWQKEMFGRSGLTEASRASSISMADAEAQTLAFIKEHVPEPRTAPLCGNSIGTDRTFLYKDMRSLHDYLHYRNVDVSSFKEVLRRWYPQRYEEVKKTGLNKPDTHRALEDIRWSIQELRLYRDNFMVPPPSV